MLPRKVRLHKNRDYIRVYRHGRKFTLHWLRVFYSPNGLSHSRVGVVIPNSVVKLATARNRLKRQLCAAVARELPTFPPSLDVVFLVKSVPQDTSFPAFTHAVKKSVMQIRCLRYAHTPQV